VPPEAEKTAARAIRNLLAAVDRGTLRATTRDVALVRRLEGAAAALEAVATRLEPETHERHRVDPGTDQ